MISALVGENSFAIRQAVSAIADSFPGQPERYDGEALSLEDIADLFGGNTLFATERLVIIRDLSANTLVWSRLPEWLDRIADTTHVVLIDEKLDKRAVAFKALKAAGAVQEFPLWSNRDRMLAQKWLQEQAKQAGVVLSSRLAGQLLERVGLDQWQLVNAIEKLSLLDTVTAETIDEYIDAQPSENIFQLLEIAVSGNDDRLRQAISTLRLTEDPHAVFALLSAQVVQLASIAHASAQDNPVKDFGIHPFVASKLARMAKKVGRDGSERLVRLFARTDDQLKRSAGEPWQLVEKALHQL